ncbi:MAG: ATP-dependent RecD-like DNA helicase [Bacilli bacterium]
MPLKIKAKAMREMYHNNDFYIITFVPIGTYRELKVNQYFNFSCKGELSWVTIGQEYELVVEELETSKYGTSYKIIDCPTLECLEDIKEEDELGILQSVTTTTQAKYVNDGCPNFVRMVLDNRLEEIDLSKIYNVGEFRAKCYARILLEKYKYFYLIKQYKEYEINVTDCKTLYTNFIDDNGIEKNFKDRPYYILAQVLNRSFDKVDKMLLGIRPDLKDSFQRIESMELDILGRNEIDGSSRMNGSDLYYYAHEYGMDELLKQVKDVAENSELIYFDKESKDLAKMSTYNAEYRIADFIEERLKNSNVLDIDYKKYGNLGDFEMTDLQLNALENFCKYNFSILCGYSGSGKSASVKGLVNLMEDNGLSYTLLSTTGKASRVLSQATNRDASTVHKRCYNGDIDTDCVILDESSMCSLDVFIMLLNSIINKNVRIVLVGDHAQLSAIGLSKIFTDLIESDRVPKTILDEIFRYTSDGSLFVATNIRKGINFFDDNSMVVKNENNYSIQNNYKFINTDEVFDTTLAEYKRLLNKGINRDDILILSPFNVGDSGTYALNNAIQGEINPPKKGDVCHSRKINNIGIVFRVNDLVVNKKNDYSIATYDGYKKMQEEDYLSEDDVETSIVLNGQVGTIMEVLKDGLIIKFDEELLYFNKLKMNRLLLGYAISTHSSQGSSVDYCISIVSNQHIRMLSKELLYVADTRCRIAHTDIGDIGTFIDALKINENKLRKTWLLGLLQKLIPNCIDN